MNSTISVSMLASSLSDVSLYIHCSVLVNWGFFLVFLFKNLSQPSFFCHWDIEDQQPRRPASAHLFVVLSQTQHNLGGIYSYMSPPCWWQCVSAAEKFINMIIIFVNPQKFCGLPKSAFHSDKRLLFCSSPRDAVGRSSCKLSGRAARHHLLEMPGRDRS